MTVKSKNSEKVWFSGEKIQNKDFIVQECKNCKNIDSDTVKLKRYNKLAWKEELDNHIPHREDLCLKCLKGHKCTDRYN